MPSHPEISVVIPLCNEAPTLEPLFEQIAEVMAAESVGHFEVIFVDDGSKDASWDTLQKLKGVHPTKIQGIRFRRNYGKAEALSAGFAEAKGAIIISMDADLQDEPSEIPVFIKKLKEGYDCVSGWKQLREDPLGKTLPSRVFNWCTRIASGVNLHDFNCGFKAYNAEAIQSIDLYGELHRYIPVLLAADGYRIAEIPVQHHRRTHGVSKYGWKRLFKGGLDLITVIVITRYLKRPGHFFGGFGIISAFSGFSILSLLSFQKIVLGISIGGRPLFFLGILLMLLGIQLISTGLLGELVNYNTRKARSSSSLQLQDTL
jgi:glycosyltransferase involved in cell wall biosynthesis